MTFRRLTFALVCCLLFFPLTALRNGLAQSPAPPPLEFFKNYFVTGDYIAAGVGLDGAGVNGIATGSIVLSGAPVGAEAVAAYLVWQVVTANGPESGTVGVTFNGQPLYSDRIDPVTLEAEGSLAQIANPGGTAPCWSSGGGTGQSGGNKLTFTYRAEVLRFLDLEADGRGRHRINGPYTVQVPDSGNGNATPNAMGASLIVVYRDADPSAELKSVVLYDGSYTMDNSTDSMSLTMEGFYNPLEDSLWKMTHIVGSAQANKAERFLIRDGGSQDTVIYTDFNTFQSADPGNSWDTYTTPTFSLSGDTVTTEVDHEGFSSFDCITWGAVAVSGPVSDSDDDGLLDRWETESPIYDPHGQELPDLTMLANPLRKDLFIEFGYMDTAGAYQYGGVPDPSSGTSLPAVVKPQHSHLPSQNVVKMLGDAFANAPVSNPDGSSGIDVHVDAGDAYGQLMPGDPAFDYVIPTTMAPRGGESLDEMDTVCTRDAGDPSWVCQFEYYPGTVGWKSGFRFLRDGWVDPTTGAPVSLTNAQEDVCESTGEFDGTCRRRFDRVRKDMFRYVLFAHALGIPKADCFIDDPASPSFGFPDDDCMEFNPGNPDAFEPGFYVTVTNTGVGDFPGGDGIVTLGGFDDPSGLPIGTEYMQASTVMHELGHQSWLRHGGVTIDPITQQPVLDPLTGLSVPEPNCKPNYLSVMNYLFQLRGLRDDAGVPHVDFSRQSFDALPETNVSEPGGLTGDTPPLYRTGWYAPLALVPGAPGPIGTPATRHCNGSPLLTDGSGNPTEPPIARVDSLTELATANALDWNWNGATDSAFSQDLNFDGKVEDLNAGYNDWVNLRLNQVGSRRNVGGWYWVIDPATGQPVAFMGPLSLDVGRGDLGRGDLGRGDLGRGDLGRGDLGRGDLGRGDLGRGDLGRGDLGRGDLGRGDLGRGDLGRGDLGRGDLGSGEDEAFELDADLAAASGYTPPTTFTASVIGQLSAGTTVDCTGIPDDQCNRVLLTWSSPTSGTVTDYWVWRALVPDGTTTVTNISELDDRELVVFISAVLGQDSYSYVDGREPTNGTWAYFATATFDTGGESGESNVQIVEVVTEPPVAEDDSYSIDQDTTLDVAAPGVLGNDSDPDSASITAELVTGPAGGNTVTLNADGSFTYTPDPGFYGPDSFTYVARDSGSNTSNPATVYITVNRISYQLIGVQNIPIPNKPQKAGSALPLKWQLWRNGALVDSSAARPVVQVFAQGGDPTQGDIPLFEVAEDSGNSSLRPGTVDNDWTWYFNWQLDNPDTGVKLPAGKYAVWILSRQSGQPFPVGTVTVK